MPKKLTKKRVLKAVKSRKNAKDDHTHDEDGAEEAKAPPAAAGEDAEAVVREADDEADDEGVDDGEEEVKEEDEDANIESHYVQLKTGGYTRVCCNVAQMQEKVLGVGALFEYAQALGSSFAPFVQPAVEATAAIDAKIAQAKALLGMYAESSSGARGRLDCTLHVCCTYCFQR